MKFTFTFISIIAVIGQAGFGQSLRIVETKPAGSNVGQLLPVSHPDHSRAEIAVNSFRAKVPQHTTITPSSFYAVNSTALTELFPNWRFYRANCTITVGAPPTASTALLSLSFAVSDSETVILPSEGDRKEFGEFLKKRGVDLSTNDTATKVWNAYCEINGHSATDAAPQRISKNTIRLGESRKTRTVGKSNDGEQIHEELSTYLELQVGDNGKVVSGSSKSTTVRSGRK